MDLTAVLQRPIPDFTAPRNQNTRYREYPLDISGARNAEPLVDIAQYGIAGQSYYSRPNKTTGESLPGVASVVWLRRSIAEKLAAINYELQRSDEVAELIGGRVELYVDEGLRSAKVQHDLYKTYVPALIRAQHPSWSEQQVLARRNELISRPSDGPMSPAPHATGAAVDLKPRFVQDRLDFVPSAVVPMNSVRTASFGTANPDYFERKKAITKADEIARRNRRAFYWVMRGALNNDDFGFVVNPTEWWHWSFGDQMWAARTLAPQAFFGLPGEKFL